MRTPKVLHLMNLLSFLFIFLLGASCDFSSGLHREIIAAQNFVSNQEYDKAVQVYEGILRKNPAKQIREKVNFQLAEIYYLYLNQQIRALSYYQYIVTNVQDPLWQVKALEKMAEINYSHAKNYPDAIRAYQTLLKFKPKLTNTDFYFFRIGESYFELNNYNKAKDYFNEMRFNTNHVYHIESFYYLGLIEFYQQHWNESVELWLEYIKREKRKDMIVKTKFLIANSYESSEKLKEAYNIYYSLLGDYPNPEVIKERLKSLFKRRVARKR